MSTPADQVNPDLSAEEAELELTLRKRLGDDQVAIDVFRAGLDMEDFEGSPAGKQLISEQVDVMQESFNTWIKSDDPCTEDVKMAHFRGRVALEIISEVKTAVLRGKEAEATLQET